MTHEGEVRFKKMAIYLAKAAAIESELYGEDRAKFAELLHKARLVGFAKIRALAFLLKEAAKKRDA